MKAISTSAAALLAAAMVLCVSCDGNDENFGINEEEGRTYFYPGRSGNLPPAKSDSYPGNRKEYSESRRVLLFYECGFNSLYDYLSTNMEDDLEKGYIPTSRRSDDVILIYSKFARNGSYKDVPSYLRRLYKDSEGNIVSDTLVTYPSNVVATSPSTMSEVLSYVRSNFPAKGYGMIFSSHGSGWLPTGYYNSPSTFERTHSKSSGMKYSRGRLDVPQGSMDTDDPYAGMVRSLGQDRMSSGDVEMSVAEFASGIPFHLDYLLFDMCFGAGMEVVYGMKDKADYLGVSPAEVLAAGMFDYTCLTDYLFKTPEADLKGLFEYSFNRYDSQSGEYRSATVTLARTDGLEELATVCKELFAKYSDAVANAPTGRIQVYFRLNRHYFYDLEDTFAKCGASEADMARLRSAIERCIVYRKATPTFLGNAFTINTYSGFSIYLPCAGTPLLDSYYADEAWNKAVELVK